MCVTANRIESNRIESTANFIFKAKPLLYFRFRKCQSKNGAASTPATAAAAAAAIELDDVENIDRINSNQRHQQMNEPKNDITEKNMSTRTTHTHTHTIRECTLLGRRDAVGGRAVGLALQSNVHAKLLCAMIIFRR